MKQNKASEIFEGKDSSLRKTFDEAVKHDQVTIPVNWHEMDKYDKQSWCEKNGYVQCDDHCMALENPVTLEEHAKTLEHYKGHSLLSGCSHAC